MIPDTTLEKPTPAKRHRKLGLWVGSGTAALLLFATGTLLAIRFFASAQQVNIPNNIIQNTKTALYLPSKLPGNYKIDSKSFLVAEEGVVIFQANDGAGGQLVFSEQSKPQDFNFDDFYKQQVQEAKTLSGAPFPSVVGKNNQGRLLVSIVAGNTWIIATTQSPLNENDFLLIAQSMHRYTP
jgi:hypothetical protein